MSTQRQDDLESTPVSFHRYTAAEAASLQSTVKDVYASAYIEAIASGHSFDTIDAFMSRFAIYVANPSFDLVVAYEGDRPIGQAWGWPLSEDTRWWAGLDAEPELGFTREDGRRTFALSEIMVARDRTGRGIAHDLHDRLLSARSEQRATLLVEPENTAARRAYLHWGWRKAAQLRPAWDDAPIFDVFIKLLPRQDT
jgi:GNAT superfamily N-acetyltransferase